MLIGAMNKNKNARLVRIFKFIGWPEWEWGGHWKQRLVFKKEIHSWIIEDRPEGVGNPHPWSHAQEDLAHYIIDALIEKHINAELKRRSYDVIYGETISIRSPGGRIIASGTIPVPVLLEGCEKLIDQGAIQ